MLRHINWQIVSDISKIRGQAIEDEITSTVPNIGNILPVDKAPHPRTLEKLQIKFLKKQTTVSIT
jgi:hypothetical protein